MRILQCVICFCAVLFCASLLSAQRASSFHDGQKEQIYVLRSVRTSRVTPTEYCAESRTAFVNAVFEDQYVFRAVRTRAKDGAVIDAMGKKMASVHACFGKTSDASVLNFYGEGDLAGTHFVGKGKCTFLKTDFPEPGLNEATCFLQLGGLNDPYIGGLLTSNSLLSRAVIGDKSNPPGYIQPSIAAVRLWRHR
jgi:hypothetical protein